MINNYLHLEWIFFISRGNIPFHSFPFLLSVSTQQVAALHKENQEHIECFFQVIIGYSGEQDVILPGQQEACMDAKK